LLLSCIRKLSLKMLNAHLADILTGQSCTI